MKDKYSQYCLGRILNSRKEVSQKSIEMLKVFKNLLRLQGGSICYLRSDNEFRTKSLASYCAEEGIIQEFTAPHSSFQNGGAENFNGLMKNKMRILINESGIPKHLWTYCFNHVLFLLNNTLRRNQQETPEQLVTKQEKHIDSELLPFGCQLFAYNYNRKQKLFDPSINGIFLGYDKTNKIVNVYDSKSRRVFRTSAWKGMSEIFPLNQTWTFFEDNERNTTHLNEYTDNEENNENQCSSTILGGNGISFITSSNSTSSPISNQSVTSQDEDMEENPTNVSETQEIESIRKTNIQIDATSADSDLDYPMDHAYSDEDSSDTTEVLDEIDTANGILNKEGKQKSKTVTKRAHKVNKKQNSATVSKISKTLINRVRNNDDSNEPISNPVSHINTKEKERDTNLLVTNSTPRKAITDTGTNTNAIVRRNRNTEIQIVQHIPKRGLELDTSVEAPQPIKKRIKFIPHAVSELRRLRSNSGMIDQSTVQGKEDNTEPNSVEVISLNSDSDHINDVNLLVSKRKYDIPNTYGEVLRSPEKKRWLLSMEEELLAMNTKSVFQNVNKTNLPENTLLVKGRWVFTVKQESDGTERFKARLVAKGFTQERGENYVENYAPVMRYETLRFALSIAATNGWLIAQMDAKTAFLNGNIDYVTYMQPPPGTNTPPGKVWKLKKGIYGLKQAPLIWYKKLSSTLLKAGFKTSILEPCLFYNSNSIILIYVDDILIVGLDEKAINIAKRTLKQAFVMKDMGRPKMFLGINIDVIKDGFKLSMKDTIERIAENFDIVETQRKIETPIVKGFDKNTNDNSPELSASDHSTYRSVVGTLTFIANTVRVDIAFTVSFLSRHLQKPRQSHLKAAYRVIHYLLKTKNTGLIFGKNKGKLPFKDFRYLDKTAEVKLQDYPKTGKFELITLTDADWAGNVEDRSSQSGQITMLNGNIISWSSRKQRTVAESSAESEYMAISDGTKTALFFKNLMTEIRMNCSYIELCVDNMAALTLSSHNTLHQKTKHIDIKYHRIRQLVEDKTVKLNYVNTKMNIADILTKTLDGTTFKILLKLIYGSHYIKDISN